MAPDAMPATMLLSLLVGLLGASAHAAAPEPGRWSGVVEVPGRPLVVIVDLGRRDGVWAGSITLPGLGLAGHPLNSIAATDNHVSFEIAGALAVAPHGAATVRLRTTDPGRMSGEFLQGGLAAPIALVRAGSAQVQAPLRSTRVRAQLQGTWTGRYELGGYPRQVTVELGNPSDGGPATARWVIVGKATTDVPVDLVVEEGEFLALSSSSMRLGFEGRIARDAREIRGAVLLGGLELPMVLTRPGSAP